MVPGSDFVVARTALRSNASNYYVDGRKSSFGEVTDLLKAKGVDLDNNRFLILQARLRPRLFLLQQLARACRRVHVSCPTRPASPC